MSSIKPKFILYVSGSECKNNVESIKQVLDEHYNKKYFLKVIDILKNPQIAEDNNILVTPILQKQFDSKKDTRDLSIIGCFNDNKKLNEILTGLDDFK